MLLDFYKLFKTETDRKKRATVTLIFPFSLGVGVTMSSATPAASPALSDYLYFALSLFSLLAVAPVIEHSEGSVAQNMRLLIGRRGRIRDLRCAASATRPIIPELFMCQHEQHEDKNG